MRQTGSQGSSPPPHAPDESTLDSRPRRLFHFYNTVTDMMQKQMKAATFHLSLLHTATKSPGRTGTRDDSVHEHVPNPSTPAPRVDCFSSHA